nr:EOG090X0BHG [Lepidurus arcticus]
MEGFALSSLVYFFVLISAVLAWDSNELEIFDLIEEVEQQNFYTLLDVPKDSGHGEIKKAYRRLSLQLHPDKNSASDAEVKFRQLVGIYEILRDDGKRAIYNRVLDEGLPDWRMPVYYYRKVRKMGLLEMSIWLFILFTIGQYLVSWAAYWEKKFEMESVFFSKYQKVLKKQKKKKTADDTTLTFQEEVDQLLEKPSVRDTLPFQIPRGVYWTLTSLPAVVRSWRDQRELERKWQAEELLRLADEEEAARAREEEKKLRRKRVIKPLPDRTGEPGEVPAESQDTLREAARPTVFVPSRPSGGFWSDEDINELAALMKKYPPGTMERWEKIAQLLDRSVAEIVIVAKKVKDNPVKPSSPLSTEDVNVSEEVKKKEKTKGGKLGSSITDQNGAQSSADSQWTQKQQKALEAALAQYPKGSLERWERISKCVLGKSKEECMLRVKYLSELVKRKKQEQEMIEDPDSAAASDQNLPNVTEEDTALILATPTPAATGPETWTNNVKTPLDNHPAWDATGGEFPTSDCQHDNLTGIEQEKNGNNSLEPLVLPTATACHLLLEYDHLWEDNHDPFWLTLSRPLPYPVWGAAKSAYMFSGLEHLERLGQTLIQVLQAQLAKHSYNTIGNFQTFYDAYKHQPSITILEEFYRLYKPPITPKHHTCVGLGMDLSQRIFQFEAQYPGLSQCIFLASCEEEVGNVPHYTASSIPNTHTSEKEHVVVAMHFTLGERKGVMLLDTGYHVAHPVFVMEDLLFPHTGWFRPGGTAKSRREYLYTLHPNGHYVVWHVREKRGDHEKTESALVYVQQPFLSGVECSERRNLVYDFKSLLKRDALGNVTSGVYFALKAYDKVSFSIFYRDATDKQIDKKIPATYFGLRNDDTIEEHLLFCSRALGICDAGELLVQVTTILRDEDFMHQVLAINQRILNLSADN